MIYYFASIPAGLLSVLAPRHASIMGLRGLDVPGRDRDSFALIHTLLKPINIRTWYWADAVTASSANLAESARQCAPELNIEVFYNGVDESLFFPTPHPAQKPFQLVGVSRLIKLKGFQYLIEAMHQLPRGEYHLTLVGMGSYEEALRTQVQQLGLSDCVTFAGFMNHQELSNFLRTMDLFVLPSYGDSYASAFLEAMASGVPVLGAATGGALELIEHNRSGWLVPPHDVGALVEAVQTLKMNDRLRECLRDNALALIHSAHSWNAYAHRHLQLFERILAKRQK